MALPFRLDPMLAHRKTFPQKPGPALYALRALAVALSENSAPGGRLIGNKIVHPSAIDIAVAVDPTIEVIFLDTGSHFDETLEYVEAVRTRYDLNLTIAHPVDDADAHPCGTAQCCEFRKVRPLRQALSGKDAWITGLKRSDAATRRHAPIVSYDENWGMVKINPLATWTHQDLVGYAQDHDIPQHPLRAQGYVSIGCAPTTRPVADGDDLRSGRWADTDKVECGLHL